MYGIKRAFSLFFALLLLLPACAVADSGLSGKYVGTIDGRPATLYLGNDAFIIISGESAALTLEAGVFKVRNASLVMKKSNGSSISFQLRYQQGVISLRKNQSDAWETLTNQPWDIPEGLAGEWEGMDSTGTYVFSFQSDGAGSLTYVGGVEVGTGIFLAKSGYMLMSFSNGKFLELKYEITGDTLFLKVSSTGKQYTLTRMVPPGPTQSPAVSEPSVVTGLTGVWKGSDSRGELTLTLTDTGEISILYAGEDTPFRKGSYTADASSLNAAYENGTKEVIRYALDGDAMTLTGSTGVKVFLTRVQADVTAVTAAVLDPLLAGTWGLASGGIYGEMTFESDGTLSVLVPLDTGSCGSGTWQTLEGRVSVHIFTPNGEQKIDEPYTIYEDTLTITTGSSAIVFIRRPGILSRLPEETEEPEPSVDALLLGTWGCMDDNLYMEWTFYGNGSFERFIPGDDSLSYSGYYLAGNSLIAALTTEALMHGTYVIDEDKLTLTWDGNSPLYLERQPGRLVRSEKP